MLEGQCYRRMEVVANLLILNMLWLLACLPIITVYPATAALFGVVGDWVRGDERGVVRRYFWLMRRDLKQSLGIGISWTLLGAMILTNLVWIRRLPLALEFVAFPAVVIVALAYLATSMFLFPVMVTFQLAWRQVLTNALLIAMSAPLTTVMCLVVTVVVILALVSVPLGATIGISIASYTIYWLCYRAFQRLNLVTDQNAGGDRVGDGDDVA